MKIMNKFLELEKSLAIEFKNKDLLFQAFCHRSYLNENPSFKLFHNERLEFLGDAVIELVATEYLYKKFPKQVEGVLTAWRASLVNSKMLYQVAEELNFGNYILLSRGEKKEAEAKTKSYREILANAFEAFMGSLYLDQGYKLCQKFLTSHLLGKLPYIIENKLFNDAKSKFQEVAQEKERITPTYRVLEEKGPDHNKHFTSGVFLKDKLVAKGRGSSKQESEHSAAEAALKKLKWQ